jgi:hypothetical protein
MRGSSVKDGLGARPRRARFAKTRSRRRAASARLLVVALLATVLSLALAASAPAIIVQAHGTRLGVQPLPLSAPQPLTRALARPPRDGVNYFGGRVMSSNTNYALYWDPSGAPKYPSGYEAGLNRYFEDLAHDSGGLANTDSALAQYGDSSGEFGNYSSHFGGALIDTDSYPANGCSAAPICLTDEQLQAELAKYAQAHKLPIDIQHEYFVLTPPKVESCFDTEGFECSAGTEQAAYCAYHGFITVGGQALIYANDPYVAGTVCDTGERPNGNASDATIAGGLSHEHSESVTDPELDAWFSRYGEEVGDLCRTFDDASEYGTPLGHSNGSRYNQVINGHFYWYQQEWSNEADACVQRAPQAPTVSKLRPKSGPKSGGTVVNVTGKAFLGPVSVYFNGVEASGVVVSSPNSLTVTAPPSSIKGPVDVTVKTIGTSAITKKDHFRYKR